MPDKFDRYREALVMEELTIWPDEFADLSTDQRLRVSQALHAQPEKCAQLEYVRQHSGFQRQITVTSADLKRLGVSVG